MARHASARPVTGFAALAAAVAAQIGSAHARCPAPDYYASRGVVSFTGRVVAQGPKTSASPFPAWVEVQVTQDSGGRSAGRTVRVRTPEVAMYTAIFRTGETYRISALSGPDGLSTDACMMRR